MGIAVVLAAAIAASAPDVAPLYTTPYFQTLGVAAGLPSSRVYKIAQDKDGYLWFGTQDGLARYDGAGFRIFRHEADDPASLGGNAVSALFVDRDNRLWCGAEEAGLHLLDRGRGTFTHYRHDDADAATLGGDDVWTIAQGDGGAIWVGTYAAGLDELPPGASGFRHHRHEVGNPDTIGSDNVLGLFSMPGHLWVGTDAGIDVIDAGGGVRHVDFSAVPGSGNINALSFVAAADGSLVAGTRRGLLRIEPDLKARVLAADELSDKLVYGVAPGTGGDLWIATRHGLNLRTGAASTAYRENPAVPGAFPGDTTFDAMRDREGNLWFATLDSGVVELPAKWRNFSLFRNDPADAATLSTNRTQGLAFDPAGRVWAVNFDGGIDRLDPATGAVERFAPRLPAPDKALWSVAEDRLGQLWLGHTRGLRIYDLRSGSFSDIPVDARRADALAPGLVYHLLADPSGAIWADASASSGAVHRIDMASHRVERFDAHNAGLRNAEIDQLGFDAGGRLLVAGGAGLDRFDAGTRRFTPVPGAPLQRVYAFARAGDGTLWLHMLGALEHFRDTGDALTLLDRVDARSGWPALTVGGLQVDGDGRVWVSSPRGLWRYDPRNRSIRLFDGHDGLASSEFNRLPLIRRDDGAIFGGTLAGVVGFMPSSIVDNAPPPPPQIDRIAVRRDGQDVALAPSAQAIDLRWSDRDLRIDARALSFANPGANRYQWKLSGFDTRWIDTGNRGEREFSQLPPGSYRLELRAANAAAAWSAAGAPLRIDVARPPWATPLAYAGYAALGLLVLLATVGIYRRRIRRRYTFRLAQQQRRFAEQASAAKSAFLATMGHEIRTPMTGVLGMTELLLRTPLDARQRGYAQTILDSGRLMLRLVNDSLDLARIEAGKFELDCAPFDLGMLLGQIDALAQPLAQAKGLEWELRVDADAPHALHGDALRVKQVLLNLVNNAIKFTERGGVRLSAGAAPDRGVRFQISDDGPGISAAARAQLFQPFAQTDGGRRHGGSGLGLAICRELVARMGGDIALDSEPGKGSTFRVDLPLDAAADLAQPTAAPTAGAVARGARRDCSILLVEDDATVAGVLSGLLSAHGHHVTHAANGLAALAAADTNRFDCAFVDLDLPGIDGLALARLLRARESQAGRMRLPLVGISARSVGDEESLCLAAGMDAFLRKPVTGEILEQAVAGTLVP